MEDLYSYTFVVALLRSNIEVAIRNASNVDVHIHQTGDQVLSGAVDPLGSGGSLNGAIPNAKDAVALHQHGCVRLWRFSGTVDQGHVLDQKTGLLHTKHRQAEQACNRYRGSYLQMSLHSSFPFT